MTHGVKEGNVEYNPIKDKQEGTLLQRTWSSVYKLHFACCDKAETLFSPILLLKTLLSQQGIACACLVHALLLDVWGGRFH